MGLNILTLLDRLPYFSCFFATSQFQSKKCRGKVYRKGDTTKKGKCLWYQHKKKKVDEKISMHVIDLAVYVWRTHTTAQPSKKWKKKVNLKKDRERKQGGKMVGRMGNFVWIFSSTLPNDCAYKYLCENLCIISASTRKAAEEDIDS